MSKTGKKKLIYKNLNLNKAKDKITNFSEAYDSTTNSFRGSFTIRSFDEIELLKEEHVNFSIDTHYDILKEIKILESDKMSNLSDLNLHTFSSKLEYNFLIRNFEENIKEYGITSLGIPNFYLAVEDMVGDGKYKNFEGTSFLEDSRNFISLEQQEEYKTFFISSKVLLNNKQVFLNEYLKKCNIFKEQFPYYCDINFTTHKKQSNNISDIFHKYNLYQYIFNKLHSSNKEKIFISSFDSSVDSTVLKLDQAFFNTLVENNTELQANFLFELNAKADQKITSFLNLLEGYEDYSEVIGYHLKKYEGMANPTLTQKPTVLQEWYIPNISEEDINLIDTQLLYDKRYTYTLDPIILTFSSDYTLSEKNNINNNITYDFERRISLKIIDIDRVGVLYSNYLKDYPPTEPEVEFIPFIGIPNKIKINFNTSVGKKTVKPINFSVQEENNNNLLISSQDKLIEKGILTFQSDEPSDFFEIYRLDDKPYSQEDFIKHLLAVIPTNGASGASYEDRLTQNKKYYYVARSKDYHGNVSNPSVLYEVEIINDNGLIIPYINVVDYADKQKENEICVKEIKRFLKLKPSLRNIFLDDNNIGASNVVLGNGIDKNIWNNRLKISVTSKSTGRKMDLYVTFKYKTQY